MLSQSKVDGCFSDSRSLGSQRCLCFQPNWVSSGVSSGSGRFLTKFMKSQGWHLAKDTSSGLGLFWKYEARFRSCEVDWWIAWGLHLRIALVLHIAGVSSCQPTSDLWRFACSWRICGDVFRQRLLYIFSPVGRRACHSEFSNSRIA